MARTGALSPEEQIKIIQELGSKQKLDETIAARLRDSFYPDMASVEMIIESLDLTDNSPERAAFSSLLNQLTKTADENKHFNDTLYERSFLAFLRPGAGERTTILDALNENLERVPHDKYLKQFDDAFKQGSDSPTTVRLRKTGTEHKIDNTVIHKLHELGILFRIRRSIRIADEIMKEKKAEQEDIQNLRAIQQDLMLLKQHKDALSKRAEEREVKINFDILEYMIDQKTKQIDQFMQQREVAARREAETKLKQQAQSPSSPAYGSLAELRKQRDAKHKKHDLEAEGRQQERAIRAKQQEESIRRQRAAKQEADITAAYREKLRRDEALKQAAAKAQKEKENRDLSYLFTPPKPLKDEVRTPLLSAAGSPRAAASPERKVPEEKGLAGINIQPNVPPRWFGFTRPKWFSGYIDRSSERKKTKIGTATAVGAVGVGGGTAGVLIGGTITVAGAAISVATGGLALLAVGVIGLAYLGIRAIRSRYFRDTQDDRLRELGFEENVRDALREARVVLKNTNKDANGNIRITDTLYMAKGVFFRRLPVTDTRQELDIDLAIKELKKAKKKADITPALAPAASKPAVISNAVVTRSDGAKPAVLAPASKTVSIPPPGKYDSPASHSSAAAASSLPESKTRKPTFDIASNADIPPRIYRVLERIQELYAKSDPMTQNHFANILEKSPDGSEKLHLSISFETKGSPPENHYLINNTPLSIHITKEGHVVIYSSEKKETTYFSPHDDTLLDIFLSPQKITHAAKSDSVPPSVLVSTASTHDVLVKAVIAKGFQPEKDDMKILANNAICLTKDRPGDWYNFSVKDETITIKIGSDNQLYQFIPRRKAKPIQLHDLDTLIRGEVLPVTPSAKSTTSVPPHPIDSPVPPAASAATSNATITHAATATPAAVTHASVAATVQFVTEAAAHPAPSIKMSSEAESTVKHFKQHYTNYRYEYLHETKDLNSTPYLHFKEPPELKNIYINLKTGDILEHKPNNPGTKKFTKYNTFEEFQKSLQLPPAPPAPHSHT